jgi:enediyne biosynthesis protein E5
MFSQTTTRPMARDGVLARFLRTPKGSLLLVFLPLVALGAFAVGWQAALPHLAIAVLAACLTDVAIDRFDGRPLAWPTSALLSGLIVGFVLDPVTPALATAAVASVASLSKHLLATSRWHVFNPAALALLISIPLFGTGQSWWGALPDLPIVWLAVPLLGGAIVVDRINKFPLVLTFLGTYFGLFTLPALVEPSQVAEMFRTPFVQSALFLALFMLTDPPTSPARPGEQVWIGALVGGATVVAQLVGLGQAYLLVGLLVGNVALAARRTVSQLAAPRRAAPVAVRVRIDE